MQPVRRVECSPICSACRLRDQESSASCRITSGFVIARSFTFTTPVSTEARPAVYECPEEKRLPIKAAFQDFGVIVTSPLVNLSPARLADNTVGGVTTMIPTVGQTLSVRGPDGRTQRGKIVSAYRSTGGFLSVWIDLDDCFANPANRATDDCTTRMLVLTERAGVYRDLWHGQWELDTIAGAPETLGK
jgi:hypothetical protein